jgi:nitronate monooxygenase
VVQVVQGYGGLVFHDVTSVRHAESVAAGVDGLIGGSRGRGHGGTLSPFALVEEIRRFFSGPLALAGAITRGQQIAAARLMGRTWLISARTLSLRRKVSQAATRKT